MRIDRLRVRNFRCFEDQEWKFAPGFNVLIGDNGTGKTAVLDALAIALDPAVYKSSGMPARVIRPDDIRLKDGEPQFSVQTGVDTEYNVSVEATGTYTDNPVHWRRTLSDKPNAKTTNKDTREIRRFVDELFRKKRNGGDVVAPIISYYTTGRLWRQKREKLTETVSPGSKLRAYDFSLDAEANDSFLFRWFKTTQLAALQAVFETGSHYDPLLEAIRSAISECMEGTRKYLTFDISQNTVVATDRGGEDRLPFRLLSDGQRNIAAMVLDLGYRCVTLNPHLKLNALVGTPGVVLIDEIDLHLHPNWQRRIVGALRNIFPMVQFIVTTHSPLIVQSLHPGELIDLGPKVDNEPEKYVGKSPEDIYENVMDVPMPQRSEASLRRYETAMEYYRLLRNGNGTDQQQIDAIKQRLDELMIPYDKNEAYAAYVSFLKEERIASGIDTP